ncbi:MAG: helix-turn-helix domain-containing protein [Bacteroidales bacterium]
MVLTKKEIGQLIKTARKNKSSIIGKKYTQAMLADDLELSRGYIGDIENGRIYPSYVLLNKIAEKCEVPLSFFDETAVPPEDKRTKENFVSEISDVKQAMDLILSQPGLMLNGEMLSDDSKIALANAIQMGLAYAEQVQKKKKDKN